MLFALHLAPFCLAFSTISPCVLHQNAVHLAAKRNVLSGKTPKIWCKWRSFLIKIHFIAFTSYPRFTSKQPSRESIFCDKMSGWWTKRALTMLNLLLKTRQNNYAANTREWASVPKTCTLATASASGCRACYLHTAPCKRRSNLPLQLGFQLVESVWNNFRQTAF